MTPNAISAIHIGERDVYQREISRDNKACILFLLDQSFSMTEPLGRSATRKCDELAMAVNRWLHNMAIRASGDVGIRDWMDVGVIGYRTDAKAQPILGPTLVGPLAGRPLVSIIDVGNHPARIDTTIQKIQDEETGETMEVPYDSPIWVDAIAEGSTPMCHVFHMAYGILESWIRQHPHSFPPIVVHITDGESQDGDPVPYAQAVRSLATSDGNVLLFNCHLSATSAESVLFPATDAALNDRLAKVLFQMSSPLPEIFFRSALQEGFPLQPGARGMAFNADLVVLLRFLDMGTRAAVQLR